MTDTDPAAIARRLTTAQRRTVASGTEDETVLEMCCPNRRCWIEHDLDAWLPAGCAECRSMYVRVRAVLEQEARGDADPR